MTNIAVIYYSATGNVYELAAAVADGVRSAGGDVRLRRVAELAPDHAIDSNPRWRAHVTATADVTEATLDDLVWADGYVLGTPTRFGSMASQLKQFIDTMSGLWSDGHLQDKVASGFTSAGTAHGGHESTLLSLYNVFMHWGSVLVPPGYTDAGADHGFANPYGSSSLDRASGPTPEELEAARHQGRRVAEKAALLRRVRVAA